MTFAELERAIESWQRRQKREAQEKAKMDYILADLIGRSMARLYSSSAKMPKLEEAYSTLFIEEAEQTKEQKAIKSIELSALRFRQFAQAHNNKIKGAHKN